MRALVFAVALLITGTAHAQLARTTIRPGGLSRTLPAQGVDDGTVFRASFATPGCHASPVADTGQPISVVRASAATVVIGGELVTCAPGELRVNEHGALIEPGRTNYMLNSAAPADQSVTLSAGAHCAWTDGGSVEVTAGTATVTGLPCSPTAQCQCPFTVSTGGTVSVAFAGGPIRAQVENGAYRTSFIATTGTAATRQADNVTAADPRLASLSAEGCMAATAYLPTLGAHGANITLLHGPAEVFAESTGAWLRNFDGTSVVQLGTGTIASQPTRVRLAWSATGRVLERNGDSVPAAFDGAMPSASPLRIGSTTDMAGHAGGYLSNITIGRRATGCPL